VVYVWGFIFLSIVGSLGVGAGRLYFARAGLTVPYLLQFREWRERPDVREHACWYTVIASGIGGLILPDILTGLGQLFVAVGVIGCVFIFWWGIPLAIYRLMNDPYISNIKRFSSVAFLGAFGFSLAAHIHYLAGLYFVGITLFGGWWWYEHHPWLKMRVAHDRCIKLIQGTHLVSPGEFATQFESNYQLKWGFKPSERVMAVALELFGEMFPSQPPTLPEVPPFQPHYTANYDASKAHFQYWEEFYKDLPAKQEKAFAEITSALNQYTHAVRDYRQHGVLRVSTADMIENPRELVSWMTEALPQQSPTRTKLQINAQDLMREEMGERAFEAFQQALGVNNA
jgi:hypothetical protein